MIVIDRIQRKLISLRGFKSESEIMGSVLRGGGKVKICGLGGSCESFTKLFI